MRYLYIVSGFFFSILSFLRLWDIIAVPIYFFHCTMWNLSFLDLLPFNISLILAALEHYCDAHIFLHCTMCNLSFLNSLPFII